MKFVIGFFFMLGVVKWLEIGYWLWKEIFLKDNNA